MNKEWRDVVGYEGLYEVSNTGEVYSCRRNIILKPTKTLRGYFTVCLSRNGKGRGFFVHRLVAYAFIKNKNNKPHINHINEIKTDNSVENLEWVTEEENRRKASANNNARAILQICPKTDKIIKRWPSITKAHKYGIANKGNLYAMLVGKQETHKGFIWKYAE